MTRKIKNKHVYIGKVGCDCRHSLVLSFASRYCSRCCLFVCPSLCVLVWGCRLTLSLFLSLFVLYAFSFDRSLRGLLGWLGICSVNQRIENFSTKTLLNLVVFKCGGSRRYGSSGVYSKSRGFCFVFCFIFLFAFPMRSFALWLLFSVCKCVRVCVFVFGGFHLFVCVVIIFFEGVSSVCFAFFQFACLDKEIKTILLYYV